MRPSICLAKFMNTCNKQTFYTEREYKIPKIQTQNNCLSFGLINRT